MGHNEFARSTFLQLGTSKALPRYLGWGSAVAGNVLQSMREDGQRLAAGSVLALSVVANLVVTMGINCFVRRRTHTCV